jgi:hypothetical protein
VELQNSAYLINTNWKAVLLDGSKTWQVTNTVTNKIQTIINARRPGSIFGMDGLYAVGCIDIHQRFEYPSTNKLHCV